MRFRTIEIRWHDNKPISTCDFQPIPFKRARPPAGHDDKFTGHSYRLATGGEDNHVRVWMVYPNIRPTSLVKDDPTSAAPRPPRIEYLSTLSRHTAAVNVVRFSPNGELIASAGDDGMIIIWAQSTHPHSGSYGSEITPDELQLDKEFWKPRIAFRCTTMQVYDLAWSPTGEYILAGSTDNTARVFASVDGKCVCEIAEHSHFVQGVAWDPLNEYIATQSSDRSMHVYRISTKNGSFEAHAVGRNTRIPVRHARTPSAHGARPRIFRSESSASDAESAVGDHPLSAKDKEDTAPLTPATSVGSTPSLAMFPPPPVVDKGPSSRRSSFSASSNAPGSPHSSFRYGRSPSPMPPLPAIRSLPTSSAWANVKLYGDESFTNFFRRLTFSPDGGLLLTPAGQFEDPSVIPASLSHKSGKEDGGATPARGRKGKPSVVTDLPLASTSSVYIYSRANFARPPIAHLPGHKKASVAVRFSPVLYELRPSVEVGEREPSETKTAALEKNMEGTLDVDMVGPTIVVSSNDDAPTYSQASLLTPQRTPVQTQNFLASPLPRLALPGAQLEIGNTSVPYSPALSPITDLRPSTPGTSKPSTPSAHHRHAHSYSQSSTTIPPVNTTTTTTTTTATTTASVFALPYRMLYAVVTMDTVAIYDTQQSTPVCLLTKLHYDEFTDMTWSPDGQTLLLSSRDGYCTIIILDEILPAYHTQQHTLQLQSIAHLNSVPLVNTNTNTNTNMNTNTSVSGASTPATSTIGLPLNITTPTISISGSGSGSKKRNERGEPPLTPAASETGGESTSGSGYGFNMITSPTKEVTDRDKHSGRNRDGKKEKEKEKEEEVDQQPPKKKRRVALTRVSDLGS